MEGEEEEEEEEEENGGIKKWKDDVAVVVVVVVTDREESRDKNSWQKTLISSRKGWYKWCILPETPRKYIIKQTPPTFSV